MCKVVVVQLVILDEVVRPPLPPLCLPSHFHPRSRVSPTTHSSLVSYLITSVVVRRAVQSCVSRRNNSGLRTQPWGVPMFTVMGLDVLLLNRTAAVPLRNQLQMMVSSSEPNSSPRRGLWCRCCWRPSGAGWSGVWW